MAKPGCGISYRSVIPKRHHPHTFHRSWERRLCAYRFWTVHATRCTPDRLLSMVRLLKVSPRVGLVGYVVLADSNQMIGNHTWFQGFTRHKPVEKTAKG